MTDKKKDVLKEKLEKLKPEDLEKVTGGTKLPDQYSTASSSTARAPGLSW